MTLKRLILVIALALAFVPLLSAAKSYEITIASTAMAGDLKLAAGQYTLKVEGTSAVFTNVNTGKRFTAPVKVMDGGKKFDDTVVEMTDTGGNARVVAINLGGSTTQLLFP